MNYTTFHPLNIYSLYKHTHANHANHAKHTHTQNYEEKPLRLPLHLSPPLTPNPCITNTVTHPPGGKFFDKQLGVQFTLGITPILNRIIFKILQESTPSERRDVPVLHVYISEFPGFAYKNGDNINITASELDKFYHPRTKSKWFLYYDAGPPTHAFQWHGNFGGPGDD